VGKGKLVVLREDVFRDEKLHRLGRGKSEKRVGPGECGVWGGMPLCWIAWLKNSFGFEKRTLEE